MEIIEKIKSGHIQAGISSEILSIGLGILLVPTLMTVLIPIINNVLTDNVIDFINTVIGYIDYFIGSRYTNIMFCMIAVIMFSKLIKRVLKLVKGD